MDITFGLILYNEEKLILRQLQNLYPHAHEIIVVEGRVLEFGDKFSKTRDNTLSIIKKFQEEQDPQNKIQLISQDTWPGKTVMVNEYFSRATGHYVWHIDADEFYSDACIDRTKDYIQTTQDANYAHDEYYYYRYYNVIVAKNGVNKFWNWPARIHKNIVGRKLTHRPQLIAGTSEKHVHIIPRSVGIRHHYSIVLHDRVYTKSHFYGLDTHVPFHYTYQRPIEELINGKVSVRPDNNKKHNSFPIVLEDNELEVPPGIDKLFDYFESSTYPWTVNGYGPFKIKDYVKPKPKPKPKLKPKD